jgi:hypothetical protein
VSRVYNNNFRLAYLSINNGNTSSFQYDQDGLLTGAGALTLTRDPQNGLLTGTVLGNITDAITYNSFGEADTYQANFGATPVFAEEYTRDDLGRITQKTETIQGVTMIYAYTYDTAGRLTEVKAERHTVASYTYDR